jgi:hypothetical protein
VCRDSPSDDEALATNSNDLAVKAISAIAGDNTTWHTMGGIAINSDIGDLTPFDSADGEFNGMTIPIEIIYRTDEGNPYNVRA